jgi:hypothetical protein
MMIHSTKPTDSDMHLRLNLWQRRYRDEMNEAPTLPECPIPSPYVDLVAFDAGHGLPRVGSYVRDVHSNLYRIMATERPAFVSCGTAYVHCRAECALDPLTPAVFVCRIFVAKS